MTSAHKIYGPGLDGNPMGNAYERRDPAREPNTGERDPSPEQVALHRAAIAVAEAAAALDAAIKAEGYEVTKTERIQRTNRRRKMTEFMAKLTGWLK